VRRELLLVTLVYTPHLLEEALTAMHDDPLIVAAYAPLSHLSARHASYLVFQVMLAMSLGIAVLVTLGHRGRAVVLATLAFSLLCESHHAVRALVSLTYNPGLVTSLPMPFVGAYVARQLITLPGVTA
jgi:Protein of unknown function with HXXEE motif